MQWDRMRVFKRIAAMQLEGMGGVGRARRTSTACIDDLAGRTAASKGTQSLLSHSLTLSCPWLSTDVFEQKKLRLSVCVRRRCLSVAALWV